MQISLLHKNKRKFKYYRGSSLSDIFVFNETDLLQTNCHLYFTKHKEFLKQKESPLDIALFFVL